MCVGYFSNSFHIRCACTNICRSVGVIMKNKQRRVHVVLISGKKQSGKDTAANILIKDFGYTKVSFAEVLKQSSAAVLSVLTGTTIKREWFEDNDFKQKSMPGYYITYREFLQYFGTEFIRKYIHEDFWVHTAADTIIHNVLSKKKHTYVISDVRFPSEISTLTKEILTAFPDAVITTIRVQRKERKLFHKVYDKFTEHSSENALDFYRKWDYTIFNYYDIKMYTRTIKSCILDILSKVHNS